MLTKKQNGKNNNFEQFLSSFLPDYFIFSFGKTEENPEMPVDTGIYKIYPKKFWGIPYKNIGVPQTPFFSRNIHIIKI